MAPSVTTTTRPATVTGIVTEQATDLANAVGVDNDELIMNDIMNAMPRFYLVEHIITDQAKWEQTMSLMAVDPTMYQGLMKQAEALGLYAHNSLPTVGGQKHFCQWECRASVDEQVLQQFLDVTMTQGMCENILHQVPMQKGPMGLQDPHFPMEGSRILIFESQVDNAHIWMQEYQASKASGLHRSRGITYEYASIVDKNNIFVMHQFPSDRLYNAFMKDFKSDKFKEILRAAGVRTDTIKMYSAQCDIQRSNTPSGFMNFMKKMNNADHPSTDEFACISMNVVDKERFLATFEQLEVMGAHDNTVWRAVTSDLEKPNSIKIFVRFPEGSRDPWMAAWWSKLDFCTNEVCGSPEALSKMHCQRFSLSNGSVESTPFSFI